jgi:hypothetical protein
MAQIFSPSSNTIARCSIVAFVIVVAGAGWGTNAVFWSPYTTYVHIPQEQPAPFSHQHHVDGLGIDCRYCHTSVESSHYAGLPPTETCMTCHSQLWTQAPLLEPIRRSFATNTPVKWTRVNDLPDFVYFDHSIHVNKGIGCVTCHGHVDQMPLTWRENTLYMKWCIDCHRAPENQIRPREEVFNMKWRTPANQAALGRDLVAKYHVETDRLANCSVCHH